jgi:prepilin-type N-terminal cleavage/methylation domain-containing protein/prepilin-type processing-associated H-X9-DG protein
MQPESSINAFSRLRPRRGFTLTELVLVIAAVSMLGAVLVPLVSQARARSRLTACTANLGQVSRAVLQFATDHQHKLPRMENSPAPGGWWYYKEQVKGYTGLKGPSSAKDKIFACPDDRGYGDAGENPTPFCLSKRHNFTSYVFNGVNLSGMPNIAGRDVGTINGPARTLLVMEWTAHAPLSWHRSLTGQANAPFYNNAESVVGFVDGHVALTKIYYDGLNAAYTCDPVPGYTYKYSGD